MLAALDAPNGAVTVGFREGESWLPLAKLGVDRTADEYAFLLEATVASASGGEKPDGSLRDAWISSVVPALTPRLAEGIERAFGVVPGVVGPGVKTGVKIRTDQPSEVGSDLVCQAAAAFEIVRGSCIVADFGAALTLTAVNAAGELMGVAIAPGLETAAWALRNCAAQLPQVRLEETSRAIGTNSIASVRAGIMLGYAGLVRELAGRMRVELASAAPGSAEAALLGTGDELGKTVLEGLGAMAFVPDLTLDGLALIAAKNTRLRS